MAEKILNSSNELNDHRNSLRLMDAGSSRGLLLVIAILMMTQFSFAQSVTGVMMVVKGNVQVTPKAGQTQAAKVGKKVTSGDTITAGADSRAKIVMADKNVISVSPDSKIVIEKYENDGKDKKNVELKVLYGKIRASVEQKYDGEKSTFNVKTPSAVAGVRGTDFLTGYNPLTKATQVITFSGAVAVGRVGPGGTILSPVFVQPGQSFQMEAEKIAEPPKEIPKEDLKKINQESSPDQSPPATGQRTPGSALSGEPTQTLITEGDLKGEKELGDRRLPKRISFVDTRLPQLPPQPPTAPPIRPRSKVIITLEPQ